MNDLLIERASLYLDSRAVSHQLLLKSLPLLLFPLLLLLLELGVDLVLRSDVLVGSEAPGVAARLLAAAPRAERNGGLRHHDVPRRLSARHPKLDRLARLQIHLDHRLVPIQHEYDV